MPPRVYHLKPHQVGVLPARKTLSEGTRGGSPEQGAATAGREDAGVYVRASPLRSGTAEGDSLPCLFSNKCNEGEKTVEAETSKKINFLTGNHRKTAEALRQNIQVMAEDYGVEHIGFLTLTTSDDVSPKEYQRRFKSLRTGVLDEWCGDRIKIVERGKTSGRFHGHLLVVLPFDIRTGCNFQEFAKGDYRSAPPELRKAWAFLRETLPKYGFGRHELLPVKSTAEGIAFYVGKYVSKHVDGRKPEDKGVRLVEYGKGARHWNSRFAWNTPKAKLWRAKVGAVGAVMGLSESEGMNKALGKGWAYRHRMIFRRVQLGETLSALDIADVGPEFMKEIYRLIALGQGGRIWLSPEDACTEIGLQIEERKHARIRENRINGVKGIIPLRGLGRSPCLHLLGTDQG